MTDTLVMILWKMCSVICRIVLRYVALSKGVIYSCQSAKREEDNTITKNSKD